MPTVSTPHCLWRPGVRRHHGEVIFINGNDDKRSRSLPAGTEWAPDAVESEAFFDSQLLRFAFWSIVGAKEGPLVTLALAPMVLTLADAPYIATAWYAPVSTFPGPGDGLLLDEFNGVTGAFLDPDFVDVVPDDANLSITADANLRGVVPTNVERTVTARAAVAGEAFGDWLVEVSSANVVHHDAVLTAPAPSNAVAFAVYGVHLEVPGRISVPQPAHPTAGIDAGAIKVPHSVQVDGGGFVHGHHVGPGPDQLRNLGKLKG